MATWVKLDDQIIDLDHIVRVAPVGGSIGLYVVGVKGDPIVVNDTGENWSVLGLAFHSATSHRLGTPEERGFT